MRVLATLSILASSMLFTQPASAIGTLYSIETGSGDVRCSDRGFFTISNNAVIGSEDCYGSVIIPLGVTSIATGGFRRSSIDSATIPNSVTSIGNGAFEDAWYLASITIPDSVIELGVDVFKGDDNLLSATIGSGITTIPYRTFAYAKHLTSVTIPSSVTRIESTAFYQTSSLASITIPNGVTYIGEEAFGQSEGGGLTSVSIPDSVTYIESNAFSGAARLTSVTLGNGITAIRSGTFQYASSLASINIPNSVQWIGNNAFRYTPDSLTYSYCGSVLTPQALTNAFGDRTNSCTPTTASISAGSVQNSQVATFSSGVTEAEIPATNELPSIKLNFGGTAPTAVTFVPLASNPAPLTSTPFKVTGSTKIVDIQISGSFTGLATVCLDGAATDSVFHFTGGQWVELANRTYANGQVCGDTTSFSPFTAALANTSPTAPTAVVATATGKRSATISFSAPADNGGTAITSYTAISTPGSISKTLTQAAGGAFTFDNLQPATSYTFTVTATNAVGTSADVTSNSIKTDSLVPASLTAITFTDDGTGTAGKLTWSGKNIDAVLYTGPANSYPGPFTFGAFSTGWNGTIRNLTPDTEYTVSILAISTDGIGESKSLTFKTGAKKDVVQDLSHWSTWLAANTFASNESASLLGLLNKFNSLETSIHRSFIKVPTSRVAEVEVTSLTPLTCSVVSATAKVNAGLVKSLSKDTCTISYTVSGASKAPATLVKDFIFKKASK